MHKLLQRQLKRFLKGHSLSGEWKAFIEAVDKAYHQADENQELLERSLELTSEELREQNERLRRELAERKQAEAELRRSERRLAEAQRIAQVGNWEWDLQTDEVLWSDETYRLLGYEPGAVEPSMEALKRRVHPEDRHLVDNGDQQLFHGPGRFEHDLHVEHPDGSERILRGTGRLDQDEDGNPVRAVGTLLDITTMKRSEEALVTAKEQAEEMARLKSAFLTNMSHEVRTPLQGIIGSSQILAEEVSEELREFASIIEQSGKRLLDTLNSVLDVSRLESGEMTVNCHPVEVVEEVEQVIEEFKPIADQKDLPLYVRRAPSSVQAHLDSTYLRRILNNLIGNAVKFTREGYVAVEVEANGTCVEVRVIDTGTGVSEEFLPKLFEEFKQESTGLTRSHEGTGLGLSITKRLVELMDGTIEVESTKGEGSTFAVRFPRSTRNGVDTTAPAAHEEEKPSFRLLVVEDTPSNVEILRRYLSDYTIDVAYEPADALSLVQEHSYGLLLIDINLKAGLSGVDVLHKARQQRKNRSTPAVATTSYALPGDEEHFLQKGFDYYLAKPFSRQAVREVVEEALQSSVC